MRQLESYIDIAESVVSQETEPVCLVAAVLSTYRLEGATCTRSLGGSKPCQDLQRESSH